MEILEICAISDVIRREQSSIDYFKPEYNILTRAGSSLHFKHSEETLFQSRKLSGKALYNMRKARVGAVLSPLAKTNQLLSTSHVVNIQNIETNDSIKYSSIRTAARELKVNHATLLNYINKDKLFKGRYIFKKVN